MKSTYVKKTTLTERRNVILFAPWHFIRSVILASNNFRERYRNKMFLNRFSVSTTIEIEIVSNPSLNLYVLTFYDRLMMNIFKVYMF